VQDEVYRGEKRGRFRAQLVKLTDDIGKMCV
jgi:hypothetical protein